MIQQVEEVAKSTELTEADADQQSSYVTDEDSLPLLTMNPKTDEDSLPLLTMNPMLNMIVSDYDN